MGTLSWWGLEAPEVSGRMVDWPSDITASWTCAGSPGLEQEDGQSVSTKCLGTAQVQAFRAEGAQTPPGISDQALRAPRDLALSGRIGGLPGHEVGRTPPSRLWPRVCAEAPESFWRFSRETTRPGRLPPRV